MAFLEANRERPFFLYVAHSFPHEPLHASAQQAGKSPAGLYGDVLADLDASTGAIFDALERLGLARNTLVLVTSDNGPWFEGSAGALRGRKNDVLEGGMRVPLIARWPGRIPAGQRIEQVTAAIDVLPDCARRSRACRCPRDRVIDGVDLLPLLFGRGAEPPERAHLLLLRPLAPGRARAGAGRRTAGTAYFGGFAADWRFVPLVSEGPLALRPGARPGRVLRRLEEEARGARAARSA